MRVQLDAALRQRLNLAQQFGMDLLENRLGGHAELAELKRLVVIVAAADETVTEPRDLQRIVRRHRSGEKIAISFLRGGKQRRVTVVL